MRRYKWLGIVIFYLIGCGQQEMAVEEEEPVKVQQDWKETGFVVSEEVQEKQGFWPAEYINLVTEEESEENQKYLKMAQEEFPDQSYGLEGFSDVAGNIYTREGTDSQPFRDLCICDKEGNLLMEHAGEDFDEILKPLEMPTGELIFPIYNTAERTTRMVWFDVEKKAVKSLVSFQKEAMKQVYGILDNTIYYESLRGIVTWNIVSGERQLIYNFTENGVSRVHNTMLLLQEGGVPILRMYGTISDEKEDWLVVLSAQEVERPDATRIVSLNGTSANVQDCVAVASRKNPNYFFIYESNAGGEAEDFRTRIIAEMVAGGGPEILYVSLEDMRVLQEKGLLLDLSIVLSQDIVNQVLPGIVELGTVDGAFVGLAPDMDVYTMITLKSIWTQDTWSMEDVLTLMDSGEFSGVFCQGTGVFAPRALLSFFTGFGLRDATWIDWEKSESHFDGEMFLKVLELVKAYGADPVTEETYLGKGGCPGNVTGISVQSLNSFYEQYGEDYYFVGEPTVGSSGNYVASDGVLVVNKNAVDTEAVAAYMECLLKDEIQYASRPAQKKSVKKVSTEEIKYVEVEGETQAFWRGNQLVIKEDGTTTLDDYIDLLEGCVPYPNKYEEIINIVWEEAQSYIAGDKTAKEVAKIIDNRMQLYLDEKE